MLHTGVAPFATATPEKRVGDAVEVARREHLAGHHVTLGALHAAREGAAVEVYLMGVGARASVGAARRRGWRVRAAVTPGQLVGTETSRVPST